MSKADGRWHGATWRGPVPNKYVAGMLAHKGLVLHIQQGYESGTDACFHEASFQASAHFGVGGNRHKDEHNDGHVDQWVSTNDAAWAESGGNRYWTSVEIEGFSGQPATDAQIESLAKLYAWGHRQYGWKLQLANSPADEGLGYHGMGGADWGGHFDCPGHPIVAQRQRILDRAKDLLNHVPDPSSPDHPQNQHGPFGEGGFPPKPKRKPRAPKPPKVEAPAWYSRLLEVSHPMLHGDDVRKVQRVVGATEDGWYGPNTESHVKGWQRAHELSPDGVVGPKTAQKIGD